MKWNLHWATIQGQWKHSTREKFNIFLPMKNSFAFSRDLWVNKISLTPPRCWSKVDIFIHRQLSTDVFKHLFDNIVSNKCARKRTIFVWQLILLLLSRPNLSFLSRSHVNSLNRACEWKIFEAFKSFFITMIRATFDFYHIWPRDVH